MLAIAIPIVIALGLFQQGAEAPLPGIICSIVLSACGVLALALSGLRAVTPGMAVVSVLVTGWLTAGAAGSWHTAQGEVLQLFGAAGVFVAAHVLARSGRLTELCIKVLIWALLAYVVVSLLAYANDFSRHPDDAAHRGTFRLRGSFVSPNVAATVFGLAALTGVARLSYKLYNPGPRIATRTDLLNFVLLRAFDAFALTALSLTALWLTASRAGIVVSVMALGGLLAVELVALRHRRGRPHRLLQPWQWAVLGTLAAASLFVVFGELLGLRVAQLGSDAGGRLALYSLYWEAWQTELWTGHGLGSFNRVNDAIMTADTVQYLLPVGAAHNVILQWLIQQGILGTALVVTAIAAILIPIGRCLAGRYRGSRSLLWLAACASGLVIVHGMVDYALELPGVVWLWSLLLGLAHGRCMILRRE
jgi:O-antigen ligase